MNAQALPDSLDAYAWGGRVLVAEQGCWLWTGHVGNNGYGRFPVRGKYRVAHRYIYEELIASIPEGLVCDHLCRNRRCVNPAHIEPVTNRENVRRGVAGHSVRQYWKNSLTCTAGHPWSDQRPVFNHRGQRTCQICRNAKQSARNIARKNAARERLVTMGTPFRRTKSAQLDREAKAVGLVRNGASVRDIIDELGLSETGVRQMLARICGPRSMTHHDKPTGRAGQGRGVLTQPSLPELLHAGNWRQQSAAGHTGARACNCIGPQNGEPFCPCRMVGVIKRDGQWVVPERVIGRVQPSHQLFQQNAESNHNGSNS